MTSTRKQRAKKSGFLRNRFFQTYVSTRSWPPESPAKSYLKVTCICSRGSGAIDD